jgi:hypothetical protein
MKTVPIVHPDKIVTRADGVDEIWMLWGFRGPGGLVSIGQSAGLLREQIIAERLAAARKPRR